MSGEQDRDALVAELGEMEDVAWDFFPDPEAAMSDVAKFVLASDWLADLIRHERASALREAADKWRRFVADGRCPTCQMASRETVGMVCQTCGTDYAADRIEGER